MKHFLSLAAALLALALFSACDDDKDGALRWHSGGTSSDSSSSSSTEIDNAFVGTWSLSDGTITWYIHFSKNASWFISDDQEGSASRVHGTYTTDGNAFSGSMVNPGVGTGSISGTIDGDLISLDFVEDWHTPSKHVAYTGEKL
jgi:hypothetical protein